MRLHVYDGGPGDTTADGFNVWVEDVPEGTTDAEIEVTVRDMAREGNVTALLALRLMEAHGGVWCDMSYPRKGTTRCYLDK